MLTREDLAEIQKIVQKETRTIVQKETRAIVREETSSIKKDIATIKSDVSQIRKDVKITVNFFDNEYLELRKRVERIEDHLNLPPAAN